MADKKEIIIALGKGNGIALGKRPIQINLNKDTDEVIKRLAFSCGVSKTKMIGRIIEKFINDPDHVTSLINEYRINGILDISFKDLNWE